MKPITVLTIAQDLDPSHLGGAESHHVEVVNRLAKTGKYHFHVFVGKSDAIKSHFPSPNITVHAVSYPKITNLLSFSYLFFATPKIIAAAKTIKPDVLWAKEIFPLGIMAAFVKKAIKVPLYVTVQNPLAYKEEMVIQGPLKNIAKLIGFPIIKAMLKWAFPKADAVGAISAYSAREAKKLGAKHPVVIPNGVDVSVFKPSPHKKAGNPFTVISTSSFIPRNGVDTLIRSIPYLKDKNVKVILTSTGPLFSAMQLLVSQLGIEKQVTFMGKVSFEQILELLSQADVFVRPSRAEGLGTSFIEAMACKLPIVGTMVGGIPDFLDPGITGLAAKVNNPKSVAEQINRLQADPKLYKSIQKNAYALVKEKFAWDSIAKNVNSKITALTHHD